MVYIILVGDRGHLGLVSHEPYRPPHVGGDHTLEASLPEEAVNGLGLVPALGQRHFWQKGGSFRFPRSLYHSILMPCTPRSQSVQSAPSSNWQRMETETWRLVSSCRVTGLNLESFMALVMAYSRSPSWRSISLNVPMQPTIIKPLNFYQYISSIFSDCRNLYCVYQILTYGCYIMHSIQGVL